MISSRLHLMLFALALFGLAGCTAKTSSGAPGKSEHPGTSAAASASATLLSPPEKESPPSASKRAKEPQVFVGDADVIKAVQTVMERCEIEEETGWVRGCPKKKQLVELQALRDVFKSKGLLASLPTMSLLLTKGGERQRNFISAELNASFARKFPPPSFLNEVLESKVQVDKETATRLIRGLYALNETAAGHLIGTATHAAAMTGQVDQLMRAVKEMPYRDLRFAAYRNLLVVKRLEHFDRLQSFARSGEIQDVHTALQAVAAINDPSPSEIEAMCPWVKSFIHHRSTKIAGEAARLLSRCGPTYRRALVGEVEARLKAADFLLNKELLGALGNMCALPLPEGRVAVCGDVFTLLQRIVPDKKTEWPVRAYALETLALRWPSPNTLRFLRLHENSSIPNIKWAAKGAIFSLSSVKNVRDGGVVDTTQSIRLPSWASTAAHMSLGDELTVQCPPNGRVGLVVGSGPYSGVSSVCSAALHAGKISRIKGGKIRLRAVKRPKTFVASERNGVQSTATGPTAKQAISFP